MSRFILDESNPLYNKVLQQCPSAKIEDGHIVVESLEYLELRFPRDKG